MSKKGEKKGDEGDDGNASVALSHVSRITQDGGGGLWGAARLLPQSAVSLQPILIKSEIEGDR